MKELADMSKFKFVKDRGDLYGPYVVFLCAKFEENYLKRVRECHREPKATHYHY